MCKKLIISLGVLALLMASSCTHRLTDFTVISTKNVPIGEGTRSEFVKGNTRVKGEDKIHVILCIPTGTPNLKEAIDRAIESTPGAIGLTDGVVKTKSWTALLYGQNAYIVEGTPLFPSTQQPQEAKIPYQTPAPHYAAPAPQPAYQPEEYNAPAEEAKPTLVFYHEVKPGETISGIAQQYNVSATDIIKWNKLSRNNLVRGTKLKIYIAE